MQTERGGPARTTREGQGSGQRRPVAQAGRPDRAREIVSLARGPGYARGARSGWHSDYAAVKNGTAAFGQMTVQSVTRDSLGNVTWNTGLAQYPADTAF
jgi:hypothetical protein